MLNSMLARLQQSMEKIEQDYQGLLTEAEQNK